MYSNLPKDSFTASRLYFITFPELEKDDISNDVILVNPQTLHIIGHESDIQEQIQLTAFRGSEWLPEVVLRDKSDPAITDRWFIHKCQDRASDAIESASMYCKFDFMICKKMRTDIHTIHLYSIDTAAFVKAQRNRDQYRIATSTQLFWQHSIKLLNELYGIGPRCLLEATMRMSYERSFDHDKPIMTYYITDIQTLTKEPPSLLTQYSFLVK